MVALLYTHYVGALFAGAIVISIVTRQVPRIVKLRSILAASFAALAFIPWLFMEIAVCRAKYGLSANLSWEGLPNWYDLRAVWASFLGVPQFRGGVLLSLSVGILLTGPAVYSWRRSKVRNRIVRTDINWSEPLKWNTGKGDS